MIGRSVSFCSPGSASLLKLTLWSAIALALSFAPASIFAESYAFVTAGGSPGASGAQDGAGPTARFNEPGALAVDASGNVYVADTANHVVRKLTGSGSTWTVTTIAGSPGKAGSADGTNGLARFWLPYGIAADGAGNLYVADTYNHLIRKITPVGTNWVVRTWSGTAGSPGSYDGIGSGARFNYPQGIAIDTGGNIFVADTSNHTVRKLTPMGETCLVTTVAGTAEIPGFVDAANEAARFWYPHAVAAGNAGSLFVADTYNLLIRKISPSDAGYIVTSFAGQPQTIGASDGPGLQAAFNYPFGLTSDAGGTLFVADTYSYTVRRVVPSADTCVVSTIGGFPGVPGAADGAGSAARFNQLSGIAADGFGNIWIADTLNHTIRRGRAALALDISFVDGKAVLSWPSSAVGFALETRPSVAPSGSWTTVTSGIALAGDRYFYTNASSSLTGFFRLRK